MWISRVVAEAADTTRKVSFDAGLAIADGAEVDLEWLASVLRNLFVGTKHECRIFVTVDDVEFEISDEIAQLMGERFGDRFHLIDPTAPPPPSAVATGDVALRMAVVRAALETIGAIPPHLGAAHLDRAIDAVEAERDRLADEALQRHLAQIGRRSLLAKRDGRSFLDPADPAVLRLQRFGDVLDDRSRQVSSATSASANEAANASVLLRDLFQPDGEDPDREYPDELAMAERWLAEQHDQQVGTSLERAFAAHVAGEGVLGPIPVVLDFRFVAGEPPGAEAIRRKIGSHRTSLQVIALPGDGANRRWLDEIADETSGD